MQSRTRLVCLWQVRWRSLIARQQGIDIWCSAFPCLGDQGQVWWDGIVVGCARGHVIGKWLGQLVSGNRSTGRHFASRRIDVRSLDRPVGCNGLNFVFIIADFFQIAEGNQTKGVTGGTDFLVDLETALQLLAIKFAQRSVGRERDVLRFLVKRMFRSFDRRVRDIFFCPHSK